MRRFKLLAQPDSWSLEQNLNDWAAELPKGARIVSADLSIARFNSTMLYVLVVYELPDPEAKP